MSRGERILFWFGLVVLLLGIATTARVARLYSGPPMPAGATRMQIATERPNFSTGCATAALGPARVTSSNDELVLVSIESGNPVAVVWPSGFAAWRLDGRAQIADPWGSVLGIEGQVFKGLGGGTGLDDAFHICAFGLPSAS